MDDRLELLITKEKVDILKNKTVLILGLGGVGGYAVEALARCFIGTIILVDYDVIEESNINRQIIATHSNIGKKKTEEFKKRIHDINPLCEVIMHNLYYDEKSQDVLFDRNIDFVIDACDSFESKKLIISKCLEKNIKIISCMGTGNKLDPSKFIIEDIKKTSYDPIAKKLRKWVKDNKIKEKIPVLYSKEETIKTNNKIGSISFVPSTAGLLLASYVILNIIKK